MRVGFTDWRTKCGDPHLPKGVLAGCLIDSAKDEFRSVPSVPRAAVGRRFA